MHSIFGNKVNQHTTRYCINHNDCGKKYSGLLETGSIKGLRRIIFRKSKHIMLNYLIYYVIHEKDGYIDVINILPSRSKRKRINK
jgi:hypothetical protein